MTEEKFNRLKPGSTFGFLSTNEYQFLIVFISPDKILDLDSDGDITEWDFINEPGSHNIFINGYHLILE